MIKHPKNKLPKNLKLKNGDIVEIHAYDAIYLVRVDKIEKDCLLGGYLISHQFINNEKREVKGNIKPAGCFLFKDITEIKKVKSKNKSLI